MPKIWYLALGVCLLGGCLLGGCLARGLLLLSLCAQVQTLGILLYSRPPLPRYVDTCACTLFTQVACAYSEEYVYDFEAFVGPEIIIIFEFWCQGVLGCKK
jgi:hypothetical protein